MVDPLVSFVVPVYDPPLDVFNELLDSIAAQTEPRWECILIDDASPSDAVREVLAARQIEEPRFQVLLRATNGGISTATNDGLDAATAPIIAFADHDDLVDHDAAATLVAHFAAHPDHGLVYTDERLVDAGGNQTATYPKPEYSPIRHLGHNYLNHITAVRRETMGDLRIRKEFEPAQDADFGHRVIERLLATGDTVGHIPRPLYSWRAIDASSASDASVKPGMFESILFSITDTIERLNLDLEASTVYHDGRATTAVRLDPPPVTDDDIEAFAIGDQTTPADINAAITGCTRRFLALVPDSLDAAATTPGWINLVASDASRHGVLAAGPILIRPDRHVLSVGRSVELGIDDPYWDHPLSGGPWGAWLVTREVTAVAPEAAVINIGEARRIGPLPEQVRLDVALTCWCEQAGHNGVSTIVTPRATVALERHQLLQQPDDIRRQADIAAVTRRNRRAPIEAYATTDPVGTRPFASPWEIVAHLITTDRLDVLSITLEDGLVSARSYADPAPILDPDAAAAVALARTRGVKVCVVSRFQRSAAAATEIIRQAGFDIDLIDVVFPAVDDTGAADGNEESEPARWLMAAWRCTTDGPDSGADHDATALETSRVAHLGADLDRDLITALQLGAIALLLGVAAPFHVAPLPGPAATAWLAAGGDDGGLFRLIRSTLVAGGDLARSTGYLLGATVLGPLVAGGYADDIAHPTLASLLATISAPPGTPESTATAPFRPGDERTGDQEAARRAIRDLTSAIAHAPSNPSSTPTTIPWADDGFRDALVTDAIAAVDQPNPVLGSALTLWSDGRWALPAPLGAAGTPASSAESSPTSSLPGSVTTVAAATTRRVRSLVGRRRKTNP